MQLPLFNVEADALPSVPTRANRLRMLRHLESMAFGDVLMSGAYRLERVRLEWISREERDDEAEEGALVKTRYVQFVLFRNRVVIGVQEVRPQSAANFRALLIRLSRTLLEMGWDLDDTDFCRQCALTHPDSYPAQGVKHLLAQEGE